MELGGETVNSCYHGSMIVIITTMMYWLPSHVPFVAHYLFDAHS